MNELLVMLREKARELRSSRMPDDPDLRKIYKCMTILTDGMDEHPEDWDEPCLCNLCRSYA